MKKVAFLFSGQGSQYIGMARKLLEDFPIARETFEEASEITQLDLANLCLSGEADQLTSTSIAQPAILTQSVAAYRVLLQEVEFTPIFGAGHSLGELSALACAGAIRFCDAVSIARTRGLLMQSQAELNEGSMSAVIGMEPVIVEQVCLSCSDEKGIVVISNYNNADQSVISGHVEAVRRASSKLIELGARVTPLNVSAPFHSPLMEPVLGPFREALQRYDFQIPEFSVISNVTAQPYQHAEEIVDRLTNQIVQPVRWKETMDYLNRSGINTVIELGPKTVLRNLYRKAFPAVMALAIENDFEKTLEVLKNAKPDRNLFLSRCMAIAVCTRNANWNDEEYREGVVEPYKKVQATLESLERDNFQASDEQMNEALSMLLSVFVTKKTPKEEQRERLEQLFAETGTRKLMKERFQTSLIGVE